MKYSLLCTSLLLILSSCHYFHNERIRGNGVIKKESRSVNSFTGIDVGGAFDVYVSNDSVSSVQIETDENLLPYIEISNDGTTLHIETKDGVNLRPTHAAKIYIHNSSFKDFGATGASNIYTENKITSPEPISFDLSGACKIKMELSSPKITVEASGAGDISLKGETKELDIRGSGSTEVRCFDMLSENTLVDLSGAGDAEVFASVKLDIHVSGAGDVKYKGNGVVTQSISGAGSVKKVE